MGLPLSLFAISSRQDIRQRASSSALPYSVSDNSAKGHVTVENNILKLVFYYKTTIENQYNKSGGNMYELYNKPTNPTKNLIPIFNGGYGNTSAYAMGVSGIGSTQMYALPNPASQPPTVQQTSDYLPTVSDNDLDGTYVSHAATTTPQGNSRVEFNFRVGSRRRIDPNADIEWYEIKKTWEIEPAGKIHLTHEWKLLRSGWIAEPATRSQFSWDVGWTTLSKYGHDWATPECDSGLSGNGNSQVCLSKSYTKNISIAGVAAKCWAEEDRFHPQTIKLTGSSTAPDIIIEPDNDGNGFEGLGLWKLNRIASNQTEGDSIFEECSFDRRPYNDGAAGFALAFMSWWGGDPSPTNPNTDRYRYIDIQTKPELQIWKDTYTIILDSTGKTLAPTPTVKLLPTSTPAPTLTPTSGVTSTPTNPVGNTSISLTLLLHSIGKGGDSANPNGGGNMNPLRTQRNILIEIFNNQNQLVLTKNGSVSFNSTNGNFTGTVDLGTTFTGGAYSVKVKSDQFLKAIVPGIQTITQGTVSNCQVPIL